VVFSKERFSLERAKDARYNRALLKRKEKEATKKLSLKRNQKNL